MVSSGITNIAFNAATNTLTWTDSAMQNHSLPVDRNSDLVGLIFAIALAVKNGGLT